MCGKLFMSLRMPKTGSLENSVLRLQQEYQRKTRQDAKEAEDGRRVSRVLDGWSADFSLSEIADEFEDESMPPHGVLLTNGKLAVSRERLLVDKLRADGTIFGMYQAQEGKCAYCAQPLGRFHVEHKTPLSRGGFSDPENLCCACADCNTKKGTMTAEEFVGEKK